VRALPVVRTAGGMTHPADVARVARRDTAFRVVFAALFLAMAFTSATRVLRDAPALEGALDGTNDPDAANYCAGPRLAANGIPLERTHAFYVLHTAPLSIVAAPVARLWPADSHRAIRLATVALMALCAGFVAWRVLRGPSGARSVWTLAALAGWCLSPGLWGLARIGYSEFYVGLALWLALATLPAPGAALGRVALGGLGIGVLLASKTYGAVPLAVVTVLLLLEDLRRKRAPTRAFVFAAVAVLAAAGTWSAACALHGIPPVESMREFVADITGYRAKGDWSLLATLEALPRTLSARLPGFEWHGVVVMACLARSAGPAGLDPRRVAVWFTCFVAPYTAAPLVYRLFPLLIALPALVPVARVSTMQDERVGWRWPAMLIDTLCVANVLRIAWPGLLKSNSRWIPLVALVIVAAAWAVSRVRRASPSGDARRPRVLSFAIVAAWLAMVVHGAAWQARNWGAATYRWDDAARTVARLAPDTPSVAGWLPELFSRYLPRATSLDTMTAIAPLPIELMATSPVVLVPSNHLDWFGEWLTGRDVTPLEIPPVQGGTVELKLGLLR
jgi:hypothetical protein